MHILQSNYIAIIYIYIHRVFTNDEIMNKINDFSIKILKYIRATKNWHIGNTQQIFQ